MIPIVLESDVLCDDIDMMYHRCDDSIPAVQHSQQWTVTTGPVGPVAIDNITTTIVLTLRSLRRTGPTACASSSARDTADARHGGYIADIVQTEDSVVT